MNYKMDNYKRSILALLGDEEALTSRYISNKLRMGTKIVEGTMYKLKEMGRVYVAFEKPCPTTGKIVKWYKAVKHGN